MAGAEAVSARVAAADDEDALAFRVNCEFWIDCVTFTTAVLLREELHCVVDAVEFTARDVEIARVLCAAGEENCIVVASQRFDGNVAPNMSVSEECDALGPHLLESAIKDVLFEFEVRNSIAKQAADAVVFLVDRDGMAGTTELLCGGESGGPAADDGNALPGIVLGRFGLNPTLIPRSLDDAALNELDGDCGRIDAKHAGGFAGCRANAASELREVVGGVEAADRILPAAVISEVVPVGDQVVDRAAGVTEGNAAIHAAGALVTLLLFRERLIDFEPVLQALFDLAACRLFALNFEKSCDLTHAAPRRLRPQPEALR